VHDSNTSIRVLSRCVPVCLPPLDSDAAPQTAAVLPRCVKGQGRSNVRSGCSPQDRIIVRTGVQHDVWSGQCQNMYE